MMKNMPKKILLAVSFVCMTLSAPMTCLAEGENSWNNVSTSSKGNVQVGDGTSVLISGEDITRLAGRLNELGASFYDTKAAADTRLEQLQSALDSLKASFQGGVGEICNALTLLGCTPGSYDSSADPMVYPSWGEITDSINAVYEKGKEEGGTKVKQQTVSSPTPSLICQPNGHYTANLRMSFPDLTKITAFRVITSSGAEAETIRLQGSNSMAISIDNWFTKTCGPLTIVAFEFAEPGETGS